MKRKQFSTRVNEFLQIHRSITYLSMNMSSLTRIDIEKLIGENDPSIRFVQKKKTTQSSELWNHFHQVFVNNQQQKFASCNECKSLLAFTSTNGTSNLKSHLEFCTRTKKTTNDPSQSTVREFFSTSTKKEVPKRIKWSITQACVEFAALDGRAFETIQRDGFQKLAQALLDAGRLLSKTSVSAKDVLPHPTTVRQLSYAPDPR